MPIKRVNADIATIYGGYMTLCWLAGVKRSRESQILYLYVLGPAESFLSLVKIEFLEVHSFKKKLDFIVRNSH